VLDEREYLCAEDIVVIASLVLCMGLTAPSHAEALSSPSNPYRHEKGRSRWDALKSTTGPDHREGAAGRNAFFAGPRGLPRFCPRFYEMSETDKRTFWAYFFPPLAGAEAGPASVIASQKAPWPRAVKDCCSLRTQTTGVTAAISIVKWTEG
jgi:hypothetical protein